MVVHLTSPDNRYDKLYLANYAQLHVKDALARIYGVGDVQMFGTGALLHAHLARPAEAGRRAA